MIDFIDIIKNYSCVKKISFDLNGEDEVNLLIIEQDLDAHYIEKNINKIKGYVAVKNNLHIESFFNNKFNLLYKDNEYSVFFNHDIIIQFNRFSQLHNNIDILFSHTGQLNGFTESIINTKKNVIVITGNSDYILQPDNEKNNDESEIYITIPDSVSKWFSSNCFSNNDKVHILPAGIENSVECGRPNHGVVWPAAIEKKNCLNKKHNIIPSKKIYANFNVNTNPPHRSAIKNICEKNDYITFKNYGTSYNEFVNDILNHEAVVCPQGNGGSGDNHRIYETLYLRRIPLTFNKKMYSKLHNLFPVVLLNDADELNNIDLLNKKIAEAKEKTFFYLDFYYWESLILNEYRKLQHT